MRGDQLARQWQLIQRLARSRAGVGLDELADDLGCVRRTVYRDLDALMYAGFPVVSEKRDGRVFYRFLEGFGLGDVPFTPDEILALAFGEGLLRPLEGTVFHESIRSALAKIRAGLGPELARYVERLGEAFRVLPDPHKRYERQGEVIRGLHDAVLSRESVRVRYRTGRTGEEHERRLDPYRIWYKAGGLYVIGHDHRSGELRTFAVDRIRSLEATGETFEVPEGFDFEAWAAPAFGVVREAPQRVRIRFAPSWRTYVEERRWHDSQELRPLEDGGVELSLEAGGSGELARWVLSFGAGAEVLEPEHLRQTVRHELTAASAKYSGGSGGSGDVVDF